MARSMIDFKTMPSCFYSTNAIKLCNTKDLKDVDGFE